MGDEKRGAAASQQAAELILQDESLTSELDDATAEILLQWVLARAERTVATRFARGQPSDREAVAEAIHPLRLAARAINDLVAEYGGPGQGELLARLLALVDAICPAGSNSQAGDAASNGPFPPPSSPGTKGETDHAW